MIYAKVEIERNMFENCPIKKLQENEKSRNDFRKQELYGGKCR